MTAEVAARDAPSLDWHEANQRYLAAALAAIRSALERHVAHSRAAAPPMAAAGDSGRSAITQARRAMPAPPALERLASAFALSPFEQDLLLLCAAVELDGAFGPLCAAAQGDPARVYPTFGLALSALPDPHWSALGPGAPLRRHRLIDVGVGPSLAAGPLRIDERILHLLVGVDYPDERLAALLEPVRPPGVLVPTQQTLAVHVAAVWGARREDAPAVQLCGDDTAGKRAVAAAACTALGLSLSALHADAVPTGANELWTFIRVWEREAALGASALLLDCDELDGTDAARTGAVTRLVERLEGVLLVACRERLRVVRRPMITFDVPKPGSSEQRATWMGALGGAAERLNGHIDSLVSQFNLSAYAIRTASAEALARVVPELPAGASTESSVALASELSPIQSLAPEPSLGTALWDACRLQARPRLEELAERIAPAATWDDFVLPEPQRRLLREIAVHVRQRARVYEQWGFAAKGSRGLGISALFAGASGTGKTMAAEVLANELRLDLYRIDLSATVSKFIGETEKNLRRIFDAAEEGGAILLFDEADALFGKRSEVKDSHDRYANIEVGYLLQRMEAYRGLAILTTNLKSALDTAFLRRIRFVVQFPFPDEAHRGEIWRRTFPAQTPLDGVDAEALARLSVAGGNIRNIALNAAFLAAEAGEPVRMRHLLHAAHSEYAKLEKPLTDAELAGWA